MMPRQSLANLVVASACLAPAGAEAARADTRPSLLATATSQVDGDRAPTLGDHPAADLPTSRLVSRSAFAFQRGTKPTLSFADRRLDAFGGVAAGPGSSGWSLVGIGLFGLLGYHWRRRLSLPS